MSNKKKATPRWFYTQIHQMLRDWERGLGKELPLQNTVWLQEYLVSAPNQSSAERWQGIKDLIEKDIQGLEQNWGDMSVLRLRFIEGLTAQQVGEQQKCSQDVIFQRQREAMGILADFLWSEEMALRQERAQRNRKRLPVLPQGPLFGVGDRLEQLTALLEQTGQHSIVALDGIGGIGKTTLAGVALQSFLDTPRYSDLAWVSAQQQMYTAWEGLQESAAPSLTFEGMVEALVDQLDLTGLIHSPMEQKINGLRQVLYERPCLIVVDNLETAVDHQALLPRLHSLVGGSSKFLITSRHSLRQHSNVYSISLDALSEEDTLALLRNEASSRGLDHLAQASDEILRPVYEVVGGHPLALKLVVGQAYLLPLPQILENLQEAQGKKTEELYRYIYWHAWRQLNDDERRLLICMPLLAQEGAELAHIDEISHLEGGTLMDALSRLITLSLVNVGGPPAARRYSIHRLTESFLLREVIKWQGDADVSS